MGHKTAWVLVLGVITSVLAAVWATPRLFPALGWGLNELNQLSGIASLAVAAGALAVTLWPVRSSGIPNPFGPADGNDDSGDGGSAREAPRHWLEAERIARSITDPSDRADTLAEVAEAFMEHDPQRTRALLDEVERIARRSITDTGDRVEALVRVAETLIPIEPERARALLGEAENLARPVTDYDLWSPLTEVARVLARLDPAEAERIARSLTGFDRTWALGDVASVLAGTHPAEAERIIGSLSSSTVRVGPLARVAEAVAGTDPQHARALLREALRITRSIPGPDRIGYLATVARVVVEFAPEEARALLGEAEHMARATTHPPRRAEDLVMLARVVAEIDPQHARSLLLEAHRVTGSVKNVDIQARERVILAEVMAGLDLAEAERISRFVNDPYLRAKALQKVVGVAAKLDPVGAERIARSIRTQHIDRFVTTFFPRQGEASRPLEYHRALALGEIAGAAANHDPQRAQILLEEAERIARSITVIRDRESVLLGMVRALVRKEPSKVK
ncbi:hypothetical protein DFP74_4143 [Nocardiopsis sp. Huas11]|uniref:hypothetical protein n=1 Tax=Nocardiopsis sp. Huas11 TaxID=2183912 RepID=UPI000EB025E1|nr:hypothetical protein [Nocardiopsis sp. Huas11]RKS08445.1 hypothetical protein DFP74_4143 [Nocardiopsis sp. Huas11]